RAQDTTSRGVRIGLTYQAGAKPGIVVLPYAGPASDSVRAILARDLDNGDRVSIVAAQGGVAADLARAAQGTTLNYPLFARLGAAGVVQLTGSPTGLHVALHDVAAAN